MKRFLLFAGDDYYPGGGMKDFKGSFRSLEECYEVNLDGRDWAHIYDVNESRITYIYEGDLWQSHT